MPLYPIQPTTFLDGVGVAVWYRGFLSIEIKKVYGATHTNI